MHPATPDIHAPSLHDALPILPMPGVTVGQAVDFLEGEARKLPAGFSHDYLADSRQYVQEGNQLAITFGFALIIIFLVLDRKSTRLNSSHMSISYAVFCLIKKI